MLLIFPIMIAYFGLACIPAVVAVAGGILVIITERIKKNPALTPEMKAFKKKKALKITIIVAAIVVAVVLLLTGIAVAGILDTFSQM